MLVFFVYCIHMLLEIRNFENFYEHFVRRQEWQTNFDWQTNSFFTKPFSHRKGLSKLQAQCYFHEWFPAIGNLRKRSRLAKLLRTSTYSPSWIFEAMVPVPKIFADILVFVHGQTSEIHSRSLRTETRNLEIQDGEDVDVLRRPSQWENYASIDLPFPANWKSLFETGRWKAFIITFEYRKFRKKDKNWVSRCDCVWELPIFLHFCISRVSTKDLTL